MEKNPERFFSQQMKTIFDVSQAKILIGSFLSSSQINCTAAQLREILTVNENVIGYFTYVEAFEQMCKDGMTQTDAQGHVKLTDMGRQLVSELESMVPRSLRDRALISGEEYMQDKKNKRDIRVELVSQGENLGAQCECCDSGRTLMRMVLWNREREISDHERSLMNSDPSRLYCSVMDYILGKMPPDEDFAGQTDLEKRLTAAAREKAEKAQTKNSCRIKQLPQGLIVSCKCSCGAKVLMELDVGAPDKEQAQFIAKRLENDMSLYKNIVECVLKNRI